MHKRLVTIFQSLWVPFSPQAAHHWAWIIGVRLEPIAWLVMAFGGLWGFFWAPSDAQQGEFYRLIYVHVPSAWLSLLAYAVLGLCGALYWIWRFKLLDAIALSSARLGCVLTMLALGTGAIWGWPMWGTWWVWDARLTSELILLFLYWSYFALRQQLKPLEVARSASALLAVLGLLHLPVIHFSVYWWHTLHQPPSLRWFKANTMHSSMFWPLMVCFLGAFLYYCALTARWTALEIRRRERQQGWVKLWYQRWPS